MASRLLRLELRCQGTDGSVGRGLSCMSGGEIWILLKREYRITLAAWLRTQTMKGIQVAGSRAAAVATVDMQNP
jgi:hypothetical protein